MGGLQPTVRSSARKPEQPQSCSGLPAPRRRKSQRSGRARGNAEWPVRVVWRRAPKERHPSGTRSKRDRTWIAKPRTPATRRGHSLAALIAVEPGAMACTIATAWPTAPEVTLILGVRSHSPLRCSSPGGWAGSAHFACKVAIRFATAWMGSWAWGRGLAATVPGPILGGSRGVPPLGYTGTGSPRRAHRARSRGRHWGVRGVPPPTIWGTPPGTPPSPGPPPGQIWDGILHISWGI